MFFLRCIFWLSIVYASMTWAPGSFAPAGAASDLIAAGRSQAQALMTTAAAGASDLCARNPGECVADAARLTSLIASAEHTSDIESDEPETTATIPLPVPDPRRRSRDAKLARAP